MATTRDIYSGLLKVKGGFGARFDVWYALIQLEQSFGDAVNCRKAFKAALNSVSDQPEAIAQVFPMR